MGNTDQNRRILIVEDEKPLAQALQKVLIKREFQVTLAGSVAMALEIFKHDVFDLIILDLVLPDAHGFEVLTELQKQSQNIPVMVLSNVSHEATIDQAKMHGVCDYIVKTNISLKELGEKVIEVVEHGRCSEPFRYATESRMRVQ